MHNKVKQLIDTSHPFLLSALDSKRQTIVKQLAGGKYTAGCSPFGRRTTCYFKKKIKMTETENREGLMRRENGRKCLELWGGPGEPLAKPHPVRKTTN